MLLQAIKANPQLLSAFGTMASMGAGSTFTPFPFQAQPNIAPMNASTAAISTNQPGMVPINTGRTSMGTSSTVQPGMYQPTTLASMRTESTSTVQAGMYQPTTLASMRTESTSTVQPDMDQPVMTSISTESNATSTVQPDMDQPVTNSTRTDSTTSSTDERTISQSEFSQIFNQFSSKEVLDIKDCSSVHNMRQSLKTKINDSAVSLILRLGRYVSYLLKKIKKTCFKFI